MSDIKTDAWFRLIRDALDACERGKPPEQAEALRLTLAGKLPPLPPNVEAILRTNFVEVPMVAISGEGKIAYLGIIPSGEKDVRVFDTGLGDHLWIDTFPVGTHVGHLHYPQGSENVAFTVTASDGRTDVWWGDWEFKATDNASNKVVSIFGFRDKNGRRHCVVIYTCEEIQHADLFIEGGPLSYPFHAPDFICGQELKILGYFADRVAIKLIDQGKEAMFLLVNGRAKPGEKAWQSDWYDGILDGSVMLRDGQFSFVGFNEVHPRQDGARSLLAGTGDLFMVRLGSQEKITSCVLLDKVRCLQSGRILICGHRDDIFLRDVFGSTQLSLKGAMEFRQIVEIPSGLVIQVIMHDGFHGLLVVHENWDAIPGVLSIYADGEVSNLRYWVDHLVFKTGDRLGVISVANLENWLVESDDDAYSDSIGYSPLFTPFERLVSTDVGILSWHFVNGTFYFIRYPL